MNWPAILLLALTACLSHVSFVSPLAVMSVDLGSEWMKIGIVSPGVPMEIVLNKESKRKTPAVVSFRENVRTFGEEAQTIGLRFPKNSYSYLLDLLAKDTRHPIVELYQKRFPYYKIERDEQRGTVVFRHDDNTLYTPEELVAQMLRQAKAFAETTSGQVIKECVLTVPGFFNQAERKALIQAANLADLKVLQLINDYTAVALNYGIFRIKDFDETPRYVLFYDMGASSTSVAIVSYQTVKTKERGYAETHPQLTVIGVAFDRTLGGSEIQLRLRDHLAHKFNNGSKDGGDIFKNPRAMAKLYKEAGRVKNVLSANTEHYAQIEGLLDGKDFKQLVTREELEQLCVDLIERVRVPVDQALKMAGISVETLDQFVLFGAGTRVPRVQEELRQVFTRDLAKNLNTDEAATLGAAYKAADLSTGFQVKKFVTRDAVIYPIQVVFERENEGNSKMVKRTLFGLANPYPQKKIITFNKHTHDFHFNVNYAELDHLNPNEVVYLGPLNLTQVHLEGVDQAIGKLRGDNIDSKGVKAHFLLDESGILDLVNVEYVVEKKVFPEEEVEEENPFSKLGSTISKLFTGGEAEESSEKVEEKPVISSQEEKAEEAPQQQQDSAHATNKSEKSEETKTDVPKGEEKEGGEAASTKKEVKPKIVTVKEPIKAEEKILCVRILGEDQLKASAEKIQKLDEVEHESVRRATALNDLEGFVFDAQNKLEEEEYSTASTSEEIEKIRSACSSISDWLYDEGSDADADQYEVKLKELKSLTKDLYYRVYEHRERPEALSALNSILNGSEHFLASAKNLTKSVNPEKDIFTEVELQTLQKAIDETHEWAKKIIEEQNKLAKYEPIKLTVKLISEKMALLDREVKYLVNKLKIWKPKKPAVKAKDKNGKNSGTKEEAAPIDEKNEEKSEAMPQVEDGEAPVRESPIEGAPSTDDATMASSSRKEEDNEATTSKVSEDTDAGVVEEKDEHSEL